MSREIRHVLDDMQAAIGGIESAASGKTFQDFQSNWLLKHAIERAIEIISEASRALPDDVKAPRPEIPWPRVRTIGNVLRHEYHGLSDRVLWGVVEDETPKLSAAIGALREQFPDD